MTNASENKAPKASKAPRKVKKALEGKRMNMFGMDPNDLVIVGLDTDDGPDHPLYDERTNLPVEETLIRNIQEFGVLEPVIVRKNGDAPEVVDGRQRVRAAREAMRRQIEAGTAPLLVPVITRREENVRVMGVMISANEQRRDDGMMFKALKLQRLLALNGDLDNAAVVFGVTKTTIRNWMKLLDCDPIILQAVDSGEIPASAAADLASLPRKEQVLKLKELQDSAGEGKKITTKQTSKIRQKQTNSRAATAFTAPRKPVLKALAEKTDLDPTLIAAIKWVLGETDGSEITGLAEMLSTIESEKALRDLKISDAQQEILDQIRAAPVVSSTLNKKTLSALGKRDLIEGFTADDGVEYVRLTSSFLETLDASSMDGETDLDISGDEE